MPHADLEGRLRGLETPWQIGRVEPNLSRQRVDVCWEHRDGADWPCQECGKKLPAYARMDGRLWRHLDTLPLQTSVHVRPPTVE